MRLYNLVVMNDDGQAPTAEINITLPATDENLELLRMIARRRAHSKRVFGDCNVKNGQIESYESSCEFDGIEISMVDTDKPIEELLGKWYSHYALPREKFLQKELCGNYGEESVEDYEERFGPIDWA